MKPTFITIDHFHIILVGTEHRLYSEPLRQAGYQLTHIGQWHILGPNPLTELASPYPFDAPLSQPPNGDICRIVRLG